MADRAHDQTSDRSHAGLDAPRSWQESAAKSFAPSTNRAPAFTGVRAAPGQKYAVEWVKKRLRAIHREDRAARQTLPLNEAAAHLYLLVATYVLDRRFTSEPMQLRELAGIMHVEAITLRKARKRLTSRGELKLVDGGQGDSYVRFTLPKMAGPLYAESGGAAAAATSILRDRSAAQPPSSEIEVGSAAAAATSVLRDRSSQQPLSSEIEVGAADYMYLEEEDLGTTTDGGDPTAIDDSMSVDEQRAASFALVAADEDETDVFCRWWPAAYPSHNDGVQNRIRQCDRDAAFSLMHGRTVAFVQKMAIEMWAPAGHYNESDRQYIATSDKSIRVLLEKATVIEREVVRLGRLETRRREQPATGGRRGLAEHIDRVRARLQLMAPFDPPTALDEAIARVAEELSALSLEAPRQGVLDRLAALDDELVLEARAATGDEERHRMRVDAERELAAFRTAMIPEAYERACQAATDRLVREHRRLPVIAYT